MEFRYRYVGYGTRFTQTQPGMRPLDAETAPSQLFENELVVDVGNTCWQAEGASDSRWIVDHHFRGVQTDTSPCAAVAVLENAVAIQSRYAQTGAKWPIFWLVTHEAPDFDAFCSMYFARCILDGTIDTESVQGLTRTTKDWFSPISPSIANEHRHILLLASFTAHVDQCRRIRCLRTRALHSVLYAAIARGRSLRDDGAHTFFRHVANRIRKNALNPLLDSVLDGDPDFAPELALLDRERDFYARDVKRARKCIVTLRCCPDFDEWFGELEKTPFLKSSGEIDETHLVMTHGQTHADGLFLRDPESLLFKEWAREDLDSSLTGTGFLFTAIAYTKAKRSEYYLSLDPEKAGGCHLYNVWARLQHKELLKKNGSIALEDHRKEFAGRRLGPDPWYDGNAYNATIIREPRAGTAFSPGVAGDLSDDEVARIVSSELEYSCYATKAIATSDFSTLLLDTDGFANKASGAIRIEDAVSQSPPVDAFRFAAIQLAQDVSLQTPHLPEQIGRQLWMVLEDEDVTSLPHDFTLHYMLNGNHTVMVWSRKGLAIAYGNEKGNALAETLKTQIRNMATISGRLTQLVANRKTGLIGDHKLAHDAEKILDLIATLKHQASLPGQEILRRLLDASRFDDVLATITSLNQQSYAKEEKRNAVAIQIILAVSAILNLMFKWDGFTIARSAGIFITLLFTAFYVVYLVSPQLFRRLMLFRRRGPGKGSNH